MEKPFRRKLYDALLEWKREDNGTTAMLIKGARRVGKSTIAEEFARREYDSYILVDFSECSDEVRHLFDDISRLDYIFMRLQMIYGVRLRERRSAIIFDEVQFAPKARQAIKKLVRDHRYDYIETGSLISIRKNVENILIPSEEVELTMHPMDYEEFRWALGDDVTADMLRQQLAQRKPMGDAANRQLMRDFRLYMLVGGMPQAVAAYLKTNSMQKVDRVKRTIINLYDKDLNRIDPSGAASKLFRQVPAELSRNANRYMAWSATDGKRAASLAQTISEMRQSMVVNMAHHANDPSAGMALNQDTGRFKMFLADTGLFVTLAFWDNDFGDNVIYQKLLADKLPANLGYVYENVVAQMLRAAGHELYYYTFPREGGKRNYEVDFLLAEGDKVCPIEVKSSGYLTHSSLDAFCAKYPARVRHKYLVYTKDVRRDGDILCLPPYLVPFLAK